MTCKNCGRDHPAMETCQTWSRKMALPWPPEGVEVEVANNRISTERVNRWRSRNPEIYRKRQRELMRSRRKVKV